MVVKVKYFIAILFVIYSVGSLNRVTKESGKTYYFAAFVRVVLSRCFTFFAFATHKIIATRKSIMKAPAKIPQPEKRENWDKICWLQKGKKKDDPTTSIQIELKSEENNFQTSHQGREGRNSHGRNHNFAFIFLGGTYAMALFTGMIPASDPGSHGRSNTRSTPLRKMRQWVEPPK